MRITKGVDLASKNWSHPDDIDGFPKRKLLDDGSTLVRMMLNANFSLYSKFSKDDGLTVLEGFTVTNRKNKVETVFVQLTDAIKFVNK